MDGRARDQEGKKLGKQRITAARKWGQSSRAAAGLLRRGPWHSAGNGGEVEGQECGAILGLWLLKATGRTHQRRSYMPLN